MNTIIIVTSKEYL